MILTTRNWPIRVSSSLLVARTVSMFLEFSTLVTCGRPGGILSRRRFQWGGRTADSVGWAEERKLGGQENRRVGFLARTEGTEAKSKFRPQRSFWRQSA
ncbi:hypothetical protein HDK77DRAFT_446156 [Phyllosticta capitalensis]